MNRAQFTKQDLQRLVELSHTHPRGRMPTPLHADEYSGPQALINPMQPGSYIRPHKHPFHDEIWLAVSGEVLLGFFDSKGNPTEAIHISPNDTLYRLIPKGTYHFGAALGPDATVFNISQGPFNPGTSKSFPEWAPNEDADDAREYYEKTVDTFLRL